MEKNKISVYICGKQYHFNTDENPEHIKSVARVIDKKFEDVFAIDNALTLFDASVLVSMEVMSDSLKVSQTADNIRSQIKAYAEEAEKLRREHIAMEKQLAEEKQKNKKLSTEVDILLLRARLDKTESQQEITINDITDLSSDSEGESASQEKVGVQETQNKDQNNKSTIPVKPYKKAGGSVR